MEKIILDFRNCKNAIDIHSELKEKFVFPNYYGVEMSRYVQSKNPLNLKYTQYRICFSEWSVAKRRKTDSRAAVRLRFFGSRLTSLCT